MYHYKNLKLLVNSETMGFYLLDSRVCRAKSKSYRQPHAWIYHIYRLRAYCIYYQLAVMLTTKIILVSKMRFYAQINYYLNSVTVWYPSGHKRVSLSDSRLYSWLTLSYPKISVLIGERTLDTLCYAFNKGTS